MLKTDEKNMESYKTEEVADLICRLKKKLENLNLTTKNSIISKTFLRVF
jgi:hypothetical protein